MEEFKGTPGPWHVVDNYQNYEEYSQENPTMYVWDGDEQAYKPICDMGEMGDMNYAEELANARLIASAPELLECLNAFVESTYVGCSKKELDTLRLNAEVVINKALGMEANNG